MEMKKVDIIASGYEWICLECGHYEKEYETKTIVKCRACGTEFETNLPEHAYGK